MAYPDDQKNPWLNDDDTPAEAREQGFVPPEQIPTDQASGFDTDSSSPYGQTANHQPSQSGSQSRYGQPQYGQPQDGQPQYGQPQDGQPQYGQPQYGQPQYGQQPGTNYPNGGYTNVAAKPGIIPIRPLQLGDIFEGAFSAVRTNPGVMFGLSVLVMALVAIVSGTAIALNPALDIENLIADSEAQSPDQLASTLGTFLSGLVVSFAVPQILQVIAITIVTGLLTYAVSRAVIGKVSSVGATWTAVKGRIWPLLGQVLLLMLVMILIFIPLTVVFLLIGGVGVGFMAGGTGADGDTALGLAVLAVIGWSICALVLSLFFSVKFLLAPVCVVLEYAGPWTALKRSWRLTKGFFWSTFGRYLLITLVLSIFGGLVGGLSALPAALLGGDSLSANTAIQTVISTLLMALIIPIQAAYTTLIYIDIRIRKEGLAQSLLAEAQAQG